MAVLPDLSGIDRTFSYRADGPYEEELAVGSIVAVPLAGRRVHGWVVAEEQPGEWSGGHVAGGPVQDGQTAAEPADGAPGDGALPNGGPGPAPRRLLAVQSVLSLGPGRELVELARFGAWRYAGPLRPFLAAASPRRLVRDPVAPAARPVVADGAPTGFEGAFGGGPAVVRLPPAAERLPLARAAIAHWGGRGDVLFLVPERHDAEVLARRLSGLGTPVARYPEEWAAAAAGGRAVVGTRLAALATMAACSGIVVFDAHAETYVEERAPTWSAVTLAVERARRSGVPCVLVSACAGPELVALGPLHTLPAPEERAGWPAVEVLDRRGDDPRSGLYAEALSPMVRAAREAFPSLPVVFVLNRTGRARLLVCRRCGELCRCEHCGAALAQGPKGADTPAVLSCPGCGATRPVVCAACGSGLLAGLAPGVSRVAEELSALVGEPAAEVTGGRSEAEPPPGAGLVVGTEAVLHRVRTASLVVFLDFDRELLAPRLRAGEQALALAARAGRLVGARHDRSPGPRRRLVLQTRLPDHETVEAVVAGDPGRLLDAETARRRRLGLPPYGALALVSGEGAAALGEALRGEGLEAGPHRLGVLVRAPSSHALADALARARASGDYDVRVEVDPLRA